MANKRTNVQSGNRIVVMLDGKQVGLLQSLRPSDDYGLQDASGIGDIHVQEWVPGQARHALSVSKMVLRGADMRAAGLVPENGDEVLKGTEFDIVMFDKETSLPIRKYEGCAYSRGDIDVSKHQITVTSAEFMARDVTGKGA